MNDNEYGYLYREAKAGWAFQNRLHSRLGFLEGTPGLFSLLEMLPQTLLFFHEVFLFCGSRARCLEKCL